MGTFRRWKVPRRRLLQKRLRRRAGIRFAYLVRTALCQWERGNFQNPQFQPHILFLSRQKENVPLTVQEKKRFRGISIPRTPRETGECSADYPVHQMIYRLNIVTL